MRGERCSALIAALADDQHGSPGARYPEDVTVSRGIPVTRPARTLVDLAPMLTAGQLAATLGEADRKDLLDVAAVDRGVSVDALWQEQRVVVELDGWAHHKERDAAAWDREKTNRLQLAGYDVLRFLHGDPASRPQHVADTVRAALFTRP